MRKTTPAKSPPERRIAVEIDVDVDVDVDINVETRTSTSTCTMETSMWRGTWISNFTSMQASRLATTTETNGRSELLCYLGSFLPLPLNTRLRLGLEDP